MKGMYVHSIKYTLYYETKFIYNMSSKCSTPSTPT